MVEIHTQRIADIQKILRSGLRSVNVDGQSVTYDFDALRRELRELMAEDYMQGGRRPVVSTIDLSGH